MFCEKCGNELPENAIYCHNCGNSTITEEQEKRTKKKKSDLGATALTLSIIALVFACPLSLIGFILSLVAKSKIRSYNKQFDEPVGTITASKILSTISLIFSIIALIVAIVYIVLYFSYIVAYIGFLLAYIMLYIVAMFALV